MDGSRYQDGRDDMANVAGTSRCRAPAQETAWVHAAR